MNWTTRLFLLATVALGTAALPNALASSGVTGLTGSWLDAQAAYQACRVTLPVRIGLELSATGPGLSGTFRLDERTFAFKGRVRQDGAVQGRVRGDDGSGLEALLEPRGERLVGSFRAAQAVGCTAGGSSRPVYNVELTRP